MNINFGYSTGRTIKFNVYTSDGVARQVDGTMDETPASSGLYLGTATTLLVGDNVIIKEGVKPVGHGEFRKHEIEWLKNG